MTLEPPNDIVSLVGAMQTWEPIGSTNDRGEHTWVSGDHVIKAFPRGGAQAEAERFRWLASTAPTATVALVSTGENSGGDEASVSGTGSGDLDWLVTQRLDGVAAHRIEAHGDMQGVPATLARALRDLHESPVETDTFPFGIGWAALAADIEQVSDDLDSTRLPDPYCRYEARRLVEIWQQGRPDGEDLVLCHGDPSVPNLVINPAVVGWVDVGRLCLADRHLDLAIAQYSIHRNFGPDAVFAFFEAYDFDPDLVRIDHYLLANFLLP